MARKVKRALSEDAKIGQIERWATILGMDAKATSSVLVEKYGPYAHDVMKAAMMRPAVLIRDVGGKGASSRDAAEFMIKHIVANENLAKVVNKTPQQIEAELAAYRAEHPKEETLEQKELRERQEQFNQHFNEEMERRNEGKRQMVDPSKVDISQMTLEDYVKYCDPEDKPAGNYDALVEAAYKDFGKGEGVVSKLYLDSKGYPTIGNGHLVLHPDYLKDPARLKQAQKMYVDIPLVGENGRRLTENEKIAQFNRIKVAMLQGTFKTSGGCPNYVRQPATGKLNDAGIKYIFEKDFKYVYNRTKKVVPNIDNMPLPVQMAALHMTFACGNANRLSKVDVNSPAAIMKKVTELRDKRGTSQGERRTIKEANDTIQVAQNRFMEQQQLEDSSSKKIEVEKLSPEINYVKASVAKIDIQSVVGIKVAMAQARGNSK